jgi:hypothetical protein
MNEPTNTPMMVPEPRPGPAAWLPIWAKAVTKPSEQTFVEITDTPNAKASTAFLWIFIAGTLTALVAGLLSGLLGAMGVQRQMLPIPGLEQYQNLGGTPTGFSLISTICGAPVAGLISVVFFAIGAAIVQWVAKLFGGAGTFDKTAYAMASISVPLSLVSMILSPLTAVRYLGICTGLLSFAAGIYALVLEIMAVKGVNRFGWGQAIGSVLLPGLVIFIVCACILAIGAAVLIPILQNSFQNFNP